MLELKNLLAHILLLNSIMMNHLIWYNPALPFMSAQIERFVTPQKIVVMMKLI